MPYATIIFSLRAARARSILPADANSTWHPSCASCAQLRRTAMARGRHGRRRGGRRAAEGRRGRSRQPRTITGDRMTRIGFAYNQKPHTAAGADAGSTDGALTGEEEPPSTGGGADDRYAEWDTLETIDAVARALSAFGNVVRLEATAEFPGRL